MLCLFVIGQTTNAEFEQMMSSTKAPMVELEIPGSIVFTIPVSTIKEVVTDMEAVANIWYDCMEAIHWLIGYRFRKPERFVTDRACAAGQAHSGYPVVAQPLQTKVYDIQYLKTGKVWGIFHELGHNIVTRQFVPKGGVEVVNNLIATVVNAKVLILKSVSSNIQMIEYYHNVCHLGFQQELCSEIYRFSSKIQGVKPNFRVAMGSQVNATVIMDWTFP